MPNSNINPQIAVNQLIEIVELNNGVLECAAGNVSDQMAYIATLPEAQGRFDVQWREGRAIIRFTSPTEGKDDIN